MKLPSFVRRSKEHEEEPQPKTEEELAREKEERRRWWILELREKGEIDAIVQVGSAYWEHDSEGQRVPRLWWYGWQRPLAYDLKEIAQNKENENMLVAGTSRAGKTTLVNWMLGKASYKRKMIISFKTEDEYLFLGKEFPVVDVSRIIPDPFTDVEAFVCAFAVTFPISTVGVIASYVPVLVREVVKESRSWEQLESVVDREVKETKDTIKRSALGFIREHVKPLAAYGSNPLPVPEGNVVLDFGGLNEDAKTFYAELILRRLWNDLKEGRISDRMVVAIDEAHRLSRARFEKYESVLHEMARQIARWGALWVTTQNYTDIDDIIRGQFSYQYVFKTTTEADLTALGKIDEVLSWTVSSLPLHTFTDARHHAIHTSVPVLYYQSNILLPEEEKEAERQASSLLPDGILVEDHKGRKVYRLVVRSESKAPRQQPAMIGYRAEVLTILKERPAHASKMGRTIAEKHGIDKDEAKLGVKEVLQRLINEGIVERTKFDTEPEGRASVILYYLKGENESSLHAHMVEEARKLLEERKMPILHVAKSGEDSLPDIETGERRGPSMAVIDPVSGIGVAVSPGGFNLEAETGLKKDMTGLLKRIEASPEPTVIVTPNAEVADRYAKIVDAEPILAHKTHVMTFVEFKESANRYSPRDG